MANDTVFDLDLYPSVFDTTYHALLVAEKKDHDRNGAPLPAPRPDSEAYRRHIANWGNAVDNLVRSAQDRVSGAFYNVRERRFGDPSADANAATAAAITEAASKGGGVVLVPLGDHPSTFTPSANVRMHFICVGDPNGQIFGAEGDVVTRLDGSVSAYTKTNGTGTSDWVAGRGAAGSGPVAEYEFDFTAEASGGVTSRTVNGLAWTAQTFFGDLFNFVNGTGIDFASEGATATFYRDAIRTASFLECNLADLYTVMGIDARHRLEAYLYVPASSFTVNGQLLLLSLNGDAADGISARSAGAAIMQSGGQRGFAAWGGSSSDEFLFPRTSNAIGIISEPGGGVGCIAGSWNTDVDTTRFDQYLHATFPTAAHPPRAGDSRLGFGFFGTTGGSWTATVERLVIRAYAP